jgi:osmotically-inducible protein OsmY
MSTRKLVDLARLAAPRGIPTRLVVRRSPRVTVFSMRSHGVMAAFVAQKQQAGRARRQGIALGAVAGAVGALLLEPRLGHARRAQLAARTRRRRRELLHAGRTRVLRSVGRARGVKHKLLPGEPEVLDDVGLAHRVETVLFRDTSVPKGSISINAENGRVFLRGAVTSLEQIEHAAEVTQHIPGVEEVVNLLHLESSAASS